MKILHAHGNIPLRSSANTFHVNIHGVLTVAPISLSQSYKSRLGVECSLMGTVTFARRQGRPKVERSSNPVNIVSDLGLQDLHLDSIMDVWVKEASLKSLVNRQSFQQRMESYQDAPHH